MMDIIKSLKSLTKLEEVYIDNNVFKLHYKFTVIILLVFSALLTSKQYFGDPIDCDIDPSSSTRKSVIDTYCWIYNTFIIKRTLTENILSGLGTYDKEKINYYWKNMNNNEKDDIIVLKYYQWVSLIFCFQALLFYIPRYLWKAWEGGRLKMLIKDLGSPLVIDEEKKQATEELTKYFICGLYHHNCYALRFIFCEFLNLANVVSQIFLMDWFLTGHFFGYGLAIAAYNNVNPMAVIFPKIAKCTYYKYGPSGDRESRDALCILPLNIVNEKLFLFLWFWFSLLTIITLGQIFYRLFVCMSFKFRIKLLQARCRKISEKHCKAILDRLSFGDMFFLELLAKNVNPVIFCELLVSIGEKWNKRDSLELTVIKNT